MLARPADRDRRTAGFVHTGRGLTARRGNFRRGVVLVWVALIVVLLLAFAGIAIDLGYAFVVANELQNAADAAALAGADILPFNNSLVVQDAKATAAHNNAAGAAVTLADSDVEVGSYDRNTSKFTAIDKGGSLNAVRITARSTFHLLFGPIFGVKTIDVLRQSVAMSASTPALFVLNPAIDAAVDLSGDGSKINVTAGGAVMVNSGSKNAIQWSGNPHISAGALYIHGNDQDVVSNSNLFTSPVLKVPVMADPLALLAPPGTGNRQSGRRSPLRPGHYRNGLPAGTLAPGIFYVDGDITLSGNQMIDATAGCLIYIHNGSINLQGNSSIRINPTSIAPYTGISLYQDRRNSKDVALSDSASIVGTGIFYLPSAEVAMSDSNSVLATQLIADRLEVYGNSQININFPSRHQAFLAK